MPNSSSRLQASEDLYKLQFEYNPNPMWLYDAQTLHFLDVNEAAIAHYGYSREEFLAMTIKDIRPSQELNKLDEALQKKNLDLKNSEPWCHMKKNGEIIYVSVTTKEGEYNGRKIVFALLIDISGKLKQEEKIRELNHILEQKVEERTQQFYELNNKLGSSNEELQDINSKLIQANEKLLQANQIIEQQAAQLLQQSEEKINQILNVIQNVVWSVNVITGELNYINKAATHVSGYPVEDFYANSRMLYDVILQEDKPIMKQALAQLDMNDYAEAEYRIVHKSGQICWITNRMWLIRDKHTGEPLQMHGVVNDCTEKKLIEAELFKRETLLSSLINSQTNYLVRMNIAGEFTFVNQMFFHKYADQEKNILGNAYTHMIIAEDIPKCQEMIADCRDRPGKIVPLQVRNLNAKGEICWTEWEFIGIQDEQGQVVKIQGVGHDITKRKNAEKQIKEHAEALKEAQEVARIGSWSFDLESLQIVWSDEVFRIYGLSKEQGPPSFAELRELYYYEDLPLLLNAVDEAVATAAPFDLDLRINFFPDKVTYVNVKGKPVKDTSGKVVKLYGTMLDINERKVFEENLQAQNQQLIKINEELDRFVYSVSHNLRAPLTSVLGLINLIKIEGEGEKLSSYLKLMEKSIHKLDETIHEINDYSRNARLDINIDKIDFPKLINEVIENHQYIEGAEKITITPTIQTSYEFYSDESRLKVILNNLLSNAIKYHDLTKANPSIHIAVSVSPAEAIITFEDNGIGIQEEVVDKIFTMFFRGSEKSTGSGLGLYIVRETMVKLKGSISVFSELNTGSVFSVYLPNLSASKD